MLEKGGSEQADVSILDRYSRRNEDEISLVEFSNTLLKHRRLIVWLSFLAFLLTIGYSVLKPRTFTASASFIPQDTDNRQNLGSSIAAQFGVYLPSGETGQSPAFYTQLLQSREILYGLIDTSYTLRLETETVSGTFPDLIDIREDDPPARRESAIRKVEELISVKTDPETGIITFSVRTFWADLSRQMSQHLIELVNLFNLETRQSQARAEREFVEGRLEEVRLELREAEDALQVFLQSNIQWRGSAELEFTYDRLYRDVTMRQQVVTSLTQSYEQARIDEVRDTPVITVIEKPEAPVLPDRRSLLFKGILALILGSVFGITSAVGGEFLNRSRERDDDLSTEFDNLKKDLLRELRQPWKLFTG